jgi:hypothetical protein
MGVGRRFMVCEGAGSWVKYDLNSEVCQSNGGRDTEHPIQAFRGFQLSFQYCILKGNTRAVVPVLCILQVAIIPFILQQTSSTVVK